MTFGPAPLYELLPDDTRWPEGEPVAGVAPAVDADGVLLIDLPDRRLCPDCLAALETFEGEAYCPDCTTFGLALGPAA